MSTFTPQYPAPKKISPIDTIYGEIIELLAQGGGPEAILAFRSSSEVQERASVLLQRKRDGELTSEEALELEAFVLREHLIRMAKIRARLLLQSKTT
jgi:hypothetical protein